MHRRENYVERGKEKKKQLQQCKVPNVKFLIVYIDI